MGIDFAKRGCEMIIMGDCAMTSNGGSEETRALMPFDTCSRRQKGLKRYTMWTMWTLLAFICVVCPETQAACTLTYNDCLTPAGSYWTGPWGDQSGAECQTACAYFVGASLGETKALDLFDQTCIIARQYELNGTTKGHCLICDKRPVVGSCTSTGGGTGTGSGTGSSSGSGTVTDNGSDTGSGSCSGKTLCMDGNNLSYNISNGTVLLEGGRVTNNKTTATGDIILTLWATSSQYNGGLMSGYKMGEASAAPLGVNVVYTDLRLSAPFNKPSAGSYYVTLTLIESSGGNRAIADYVSFSKKYVSSDPVATPPASTPATTPTASTPASTPTSTSNSDSGGGGCFINSLMD